MDMEGIYIRLGKYNIKMTGLLTEKEEEISTSTSTKSEMKVVSKSPFNRL
jgi:hypothetical protein